MIETLNFDGLFDGSTKQPERIAPAAPAPKHTEPPDQATRYDPKPDIERLRAGIRAGDNLESVCMALGHILSFLIGEQDLYIQIADDFKSRKNSP